MGCGAITVVFLVACAAVLLDAVTLDLGVTKELEQVIKKDNFVLSIKHIKPRKRARNVAETLLSVDFPGAEHKFTLTLDRRTRRVIVDTLEDGRKRSQHFTVDTLHEDSTIKSLIFAVNQTQPGAHATLYIDCSSFGMVATPKSMRDMYSSMKYPKIEVFHERKYPMEVDGNRDLRMVLSRNECPLSLENDFDRRFDDLFKNDLTNNDLKDDPNIQAAEPVYDYRGDIPLVHRLSDSEIITALNNLIKVVNLEVERCEASQRELQYIRRLMEECEVCKCNKNTVPTCETHPPNCFQGVQCHNTPQGPRCGQCPRGYSGDGQQCTRVVTCDEHPCFQNVECRDSQYGAQCGPCPRGYEGDGKTCTRTRNPCEYNYCAPGCVPLWRPHH